MSTSQSAPAGAIWRHPALWWRLGIVLAGGFGMSFAASSLVYFTVQSNMLVFGYYAGALYWMVRARAVVSPAPRLRGGVTLWIMITGLVAHILLNHGENPLPGLVRGADLFADWATFAVHYVVPVMVLVDWLVFSPRRAVSWRHVPLWLAYPLGYGLVSLCRAALYPDFVTPYPYYFLDPRGHGYAWVAGQFGILTVEFSVLAAVVVLVNRVSRRASASPDTAGVTARDPGPAPAAATAAPSS